MARSVKDIQYDLEEAQRAISGYRTLLSGGTVQKGSVSEGRYKGYIYDHQQKIKALKSELAEAKKAGFSNSFTNVKKGDRVSVKGAKKYDALSPDTVPGTVLFIHSDGKVAVRVGSGQMNVLPQDIVNAYSNGRQKAETYLNQKMAEAGVRVENITTYVVEGTEYYGGSVFEAVEQWCRTNRKSEARVSSPGSVAGKYEMTVGGRAVKA